MRESESVTTLAMRGMGGERGKVALAGTGQVRDKERVR